MKVTKIELLLRDRLKHDEIGRGVLGVVDGLRALGGRDRAEAKWIAEALLYAAALEARKPWYNCLLDWERPSMRLYKPTFARGFAIGLALVLLLAGLIGG
jgi:hypothetical protein